MEPGKVVMTAHIAQRERCHDEVKMHLEQNARVVILIVV
jgi:hypothetical protein